MNTKTAVLRKKIKAMILKYYIYYIYIYIYIYIHMVLNPLKLSEHSSQSTWVSLQDKRLTGP